MVFIKRLAVRKSWSFTAQCFVIIVSPAVSSMMRRIFCIPKGCLPVNAARCSCGGIIKPDVVLYEEGLNQKTLTDAIRSISEADVLIVGGTSLAVYPAAGLLDYYNGNKLVLVNKTPTPRDSIADLVVQGSIGEIFSQLD